MVGRLVDQGIGVLPRKERAEQRLGLLAPAERTKGAVQRLLPDAQQLPFPQDAPFLRAGRRLTQHVQRRQRSIGHLIGKIRGLQRQVNRAFKGHAPHHQTQQRGFAAPVAADHPQPPAGIQIQVQMFKHGLSARVGKGEISDRQLHARFSFPTGKGQKSAAKKEPSGRARLPWQSRPRARAESVCSFPLQSI